MNPYAHEPRTCVVLRGTSDQTAEQARWLLQQYDPRHVLWISNGADTANGIAPAFVHAPPGGVKKHLGSSYDAVVLDTHRGLDADVLGQCEGFIWAGGALVLRMPSEGQSPNDGSSALLVHPFVPADVTQHFWQRFETHLRAFDVPPPTVPLAPPTRAPLGNADQMHLVRTLTNIWRSSVPNVVSVTADRGRGKSSALGMAIRDLLEMDARRVALSAPHPQALGEVLRFAGEFPTLVCVEPDELVQTPDSFDVIVIDEAAQISVPLLEQISLRHPDAHLAFATTARGYEGTGRGFVLRFLAWLQKQPRPYRAHELTQPIRYGPGDPVERFVHRLLLLNAGPTDGLRPSLQTRTRGDLPRRRAASRCRIVPRSELAHRPSLLERIFGLLVQAHYRTTPSDLQRLLDAPNLDVHIVEQGHQILGVALIAQEGELPASLCEDISRGRQRVRGHALPETLAWHCAMPGAAQLRYRRSVRIAVHPAQRRHGLATLLVEHVHPFYDVDFWGTLFGATPELIRFRRSLGYEIVRVGVSRGARTGEPAVAMLRPCQAAAEGWMTQLRANLARSLPEQLRLLDVENPGLLGPALVAALRDGLPMPAPLSVSERDRLVQHYLRSPQPYELVAFAIQPWVQAMGANLEQLSVPHRKLIESRVLQQRSWRDAAVDAAFGRVPHAMRELRKALQTLWDCQMAPQTMPCD